MSRKAVQTKHVSDDEVLAACRRFHAGGPTPERALAHKYPPKVVLAKMEQMVRRKLLDCGVSLRTAWVVADQTPPA
jgi:hypothetical protein